MPFPFEVDFNDLQSDLDNYVDSIFACLESEFLVIPKGPGFIEFPSFEKGYEALKRATAGFQDVSPGVVTPVVFEVPISLVVLRSMLGFTPPEWAYVATRETGIEVTQGAARAIDRKIRLEPEKPLRRTGGITDQRIHALVDVACRLLTTGAPTVSEENLHRLGKADSAHGLISLQSVAELGVPYSMLLYERYLGRPFAGHRDSISEIIGNIVENAIEDVLAKAGISFRRIGRAERLPGFDQTPDFVIPN